MEQPDKGPLLKFANELMSVFIRWGEESDLDSIDMAQAATVVINNFCNEDTVEFEPDDDFIDKLEE